MSDFAEFAQHNWLLFLALFAILGMLVGSEILRKARGVAALGAAEALRLINDQPEHGCDLCSRYRRRAVYEIARGLGASVIAFGHTADDFCEALLRNALFTGRMSALPPVTRSRDREFRLIRPLVFVNEHLTRRYAEHLGPDTVTLVEAWDSLDALRVHLSGLPHMRRYKEATQDMVAGVSLQVLQPV